MLLTTTTGATFREETFFRNNFSFKTVNFRQKSIFDKFHERIRLQRHERRRSRRESVFSKKINQKTCFWTVFNEKTFRNDISWKFFRWKLFRNKFFDWFFLKRQTPSGFASARDVATWNWLLSWNLSKNWLFSKIDCFGWKVVPAKSFFTKSCATKK